MKKLFLTFLIFFNSNLLFSQEKPTMSFNEEAFLIKNGLYFDYKWDNMEANNLLNKSLKRRISGNAFLYIGTSILTLNGIFILANSLNPNGDEITYKETIFLSLIFFSQGFITLITGGVTKVIAKKNVRNAVYIINNR